MEFCINGNETDIRRIQLKKWTGENYTPDYFSKMQGPIEGDVLPGTAAVICSEEQYTALVEWWQQYCYDANNHRICDNGDDYTESADDSGELVLFWD